ncbi:MAG: T9SS type A sorting domain-containing protein, partial [Candidatus Latescibacteria bacterium]|nr:T9SS type A sorting domain-containing protein [Candidatus Latescibacterota bacterium]
VMVNAIPEVPAVGYGPITFADERELDLESGPELSYFLEEDFAALGSLQLVALAPALAAGPDTSTSAVGTYFPDVPEVLMADLPDLVFDGGVSTSSFLLGQGNGDDRDDVGYRFYISASDNLESISPAVAQELRRADESVYVEREGSGQAVQLLTRDLPEGRYFIYVTADVIGGLALGRSRAVQVRHSPRIEQVGLVNGPARLDTGLLQDSEGHLVGQGVHQVELGFSVVDHDDVPTVQLFYSQASDLGALDMVLSDGVVSGLSRATEITAPGGVAQREGTVSWDVLEPSLVPAGSYYIYAVASDRGTRTLGRSGEPIEVRHAPYLRLDPLDDVGATTVQTGGPRPQRYLTFTWGRGGSDGDQDRDDDARIDLYYSTTPAQTASTAGFALPDGAEQLLADVGHHTRAIVTGLSEDPDARLDNQYTWDLWALAASGLPVPAAGQTYYVYGIISDGVSRRLAQMNGGRPNDPGSRLSFAHAPCLRPLQPLAETLVRPGRTGRVSWEDMDLDHNARIRVLLSPGDLGPVSDYAAVYSGAALVANSADGQPPAAVNGLFDLGEDSPDNTYDLSTANFAIPDGLYYLYLAAEDGDSFGAGSRAWRAPGPVRVDNGNAAPAEIFRVLPQVFSLSTGQRQAFELRIDAGGLPTDLVLATLRVDGGAVAVVDQDEGVEGIQPFALAADFVPAQMIANQLQPSESADQNLLLSLAYFDPMGGITGLDGRRPLVRFELESLEQEGPALVELVADGGAGRVSRLEEDSKTVLNPADAVLAEGTVVAARTSLQGQLRLEGREAAGARVTCSLRPWGQYAPLDDAVLSAANDTDPEQEGIQLLLGAEGAFEMQQVPPGRYDLHCHFDGFLDGWAPGLEVNPVQALEGVRPATPGVDSLLLAGDVAGYLETDGTSTPDNEVTLADWDYAASLYGSETAGDAAQRADLTGDGRIDIRDLSLIGANFLARGPRPVYKENSAPAAVRLNLRLGDTPVSAGQETVIVVEGTGLERATAAQLEWVLPAGQWQWVELPAPGGEALVAYRREGDQLLVGVSRLGRQPGLGPVLLTGRLRALIDGPAAPALAEVTVLDPQQQSLPVAGAGVVPLQYGLLQNYPNPFNPATTIDFTLPVRGTARLEVFDALGQRVALLLDGPVTEGRHTLQWDGRDERGRALGSGVYFYRLHSGGFERVRRMVLLR